MPDSTGFGAFERAEKPLLGNSFLSEAHDVADVMGATHN
jgi:hypothetical protein